MRSWIDSVSDLFPRWVQSSILVITLSLLGKGLGLLRELEVARLFGVGVPADAFVAAYTLIFFVSRMASSSFLVTMPGLVVARCEQGGPRVCWGNVFRGLLLVSAGLTVIAALLLPRLVPVVFVGFGEAERRLTVRLVEHMLPLVAGWALVGALGGLLNAHHRYGGYQVALLVGNIGILAVLWLFAQQAGILALAWGWSVGIWIGVGVLALLLRNELRDIWRWEGWPAQVKAVRDVLGGANGLFVWFMLTQMPVWIDRYFAALLEPGSLSSLGFAQRLFQLPLEMLTAVIMSIWVTQVAEMPRARVAHRTFRLMGRLALFTFPAAGLIALFARPIVALVYQRGAFTAQAVNVTTGPFAMYALGLGFHMLSGLLVRTFQARGLSRYPIMVAGVDIFLTGGLDFWVVSRGWGATGIAATNTLVAAARVAILSMFLYLIIRRSRWSLREDVSVLAN